MVEAIFEGLLLHGHDARSAQQGALFEDVSAYIAPKAEVFTDQWEQAANRDKRSQTMFAQQRIRVDDVGHELQQARAATGGADVVARFTTDTVRMHEGTVQIDRTGAAQLELEHAPSALLDQVGRAFGSCTVHAAGHRGRDVPFPHAPVHRGSRQLRARHRPRRRHRR